MKISQDIIFRSKNNYQHLYNKFYFDFDETRWKMIPNWGCFVIRSVEVKIEIDSGSYVHTLDKLYFDCFSRELLFVNVGNFRWNEIIPRNWMKNPQNYIYGLDENREDYYIEIKISFNEWENILMGFYENYPNFNIIWEQIDPNDPVIIEDKRLWNDKKDGYKKDSEMEILAKKIDFTFYSCFKNTK